MTRAEKHVRNLQILEMRNAGTTMQKIADTFGLDLATISTICAKMGARKFRCPAVIHNNNTPSGADHQNWHDDQDAAKIVAERNPAFEYVGNYTGSDGAADIRCKICGEVTRRSWVTIRHGVVTCRNCKKIKAAEEKARKKSEAEEKKQIRKKETELRRPAKIKPKITKICVECGEPFETVNASRVCCSPECSKHRANRAHDRRLSRYGQERNGITLRRLYRRDGGVCYICGRQCDWEDKTTDENGTIICGKDYPSIEHVIPLSLGGENTWDNVKLACRGCNSAKRATSDVRILADGRLAINF